MMWVGLGVGDVKKRAQGRLFSWLIIPSIYFPFSSGSVHFYLYFITFIF